MTGPTTRRLAVFAMAGALLVAGCSNRDSADSTTTSPGASTTVAAPDTTATVTDSTAVTDSTTASTEPTTDPPGIMFGDLPSPCGAGDATIADGQNGGDSLVLATPTDKGADLAPGLTQEMYDAATAFAGWCNEQGGIAGLPIEVLDADGKLFEVPKAMEQVCAEAFAMVGGGWAFDDQQFPLFHDCDMIDIAGYTVSTGKAMSDGMAQPVPNPTDNRNIGWFAWAMENHPDAMKRFGTMYPDIPSTKVVEASYVEELAGIDGVEVVDRIPYNASGEANWAPFAQRLKDGNVTAFAFVGSPEQLVPFMRAAKEIGFEPELILEEGNNYLPLVSNSADAEGIIVRSNITPFEEADRAPGIEQYLDIMSTYNPEGKLGALGVQAMSAYLLFAVGANDCLASNDGVLERQCVLDAVKAIKGWTGGGLQAPTNPGDNRPSECTLLLEVRDGGFERLFPEVDGPDDDGNGFACDPSWVVPMTGDYGDVNVGKDPGK